MAAFPRNPCRDSLPATAGFSAFPHAMNETPRYTGSTWIEIAVEAHPDAHEAVSAFLMNDLGCEGVAVDSPEGTVLKAYLPGDRNPEALRVRIQRFLSRLEGFFPNIASPKLVLNPIEDPDWRVAWRRFFHPEQVTPGLLVLPAWEEVPLHTKGHVIRVDPGPAFGTGQHPTTRMCLQALETFAPAGPWDLLDVGTGSGILAIYGAMLGAAPVTALDTDEEAIRWAEWNIRLNNVATAIGLSSEPLENWTAPFDVVTANLILEVIIDLLTCFPRVVRPGGHLVLSGLLRQQVDPLMPNLVRLGFSPVQVMKQEEWACVVVRAGENPHTEGKA